MDKEITKESYSSMQQRYNKEINDLQEKINFLQNPKRSNIEPKLRYSMLLINNIDGYMRDAKVEVKCKLLSSMFPEKIIFDGKSYRTNSYNSVLDLIYQQTNELRGRKVKSEESFNTFSASVPRAGTYPGKNKKSKEYNVLFYNYLRISHSCYSCSFLSVFCHIVHF